MYILYNYYYQYVLTTRGYYTGLSIFFTNSYSTHFKMHIWRLLQNKWAISNQAVVRNLNSGY